MRIIIQDYTNEATTYEFLNELIKIMPPGTEITMEQPNLYYGVDQMYGTESKAREEYIKRLHAATTFEPASHPENMPAHAIHEHDEPAEQQADGHPHRKPGQ